VLDGLKLSWDEDVSRAGHTQYMLRIGHSHRVWAVIIQRHGVWNMLLLGVKDRERTQGLSVGSRPYVSQAKRAVLMYLDAVFQEDPLRYATILELEAERAA